MGRSPLTGRRVHSRVARRTVIETDIHGAINNASESHSFHANEAACRRDRLMGASRSERSITRRERAVASGSPSPAPVRRAKSLRWANRRNDGLYVAMHILPSHRDGERRASEGDPEGAFGSPEREPTARDTAEWWRPLGATEWSRSRAVGGVSGARSEGDPGGAFRPCTARARQKRRIPASERRPSGRRAPCGPGAPRREARHPAAVTAKSSPRSALDRGPHLPRCRRRSH